MKVDLFIKNGLTYSEGEFHPLNVAVSGEKIAFLLPSCQFTHLYTSCFSSFSSSSLDDWKVSRIHANFFNRSKNRESLRQTKN